MTISIGMESTFQYQLVTSIDSKLETMVSPHTFVGKVVITI